MGATRTFSEAQCKKQGHSLSRERILYFPGALTCTRCTRCGAAFEGEFEDLVGYLAE